MVLALGGCASTPSPPPELEEEFTQPFESPAVTPSPAPMIESPPLEPVEAEPIPAPAVPESRPAPAPTLPPPVVRPPPVTVPSATPPVAVPTPPAEPPEDTQMIALLADLSRYNGMNGDELKREFAQATQALARQRSDANRVRLAVLYTLARNSAQDDQRALQLFDNVAKSGGGVTPVKQLASVLTAQVGERQRAVRDEQGKAEQAVRKLDQLLEMERTLLRDRVRSGGGGGGGGGAGGSGH